MTATTSYFMDTLFVECGFKYVKCLVKITWGRRKLINLNALLYPVSYAIRHIQIQMKQRNYNEIIIKWRL